LGNPAPDGGVTHAAQAASLPHKAGAREVTNAAKPGGRLKARPHKTLIGHTPKADVVVFVGGLEVTAVGDADKALLVPPSAAAKLLIFGSGRAGGIDVFLI
jgi:hypothetical protein